MSVLEARSIALENGLDGRILWSGTQEPEQRIVGEGEGCTELPTALSTDVYMAVWLKLDSGQKGARPTSFCWTQQCWNAARVAAL